MIQDAETIKHGHCTSRDDWRFGPDWKDEAETRAGLLAGAAPAAARAAYEAMREEFRELAASAPAPTRRRRQVWADQGEDIDVDRMNARHDRPWRSTKIGRAAPSIRLAINYALSCTNGPANFAALAAAAALIADRYTLAGYAVEIVAVHASTGSSSAKRHEAEALIYSYPVKGSGEPLDIERLLATGAPGLCRHYVHAIIGRDTGDPLRGICRLPQCTAEVLGVAHIIGNHWEGAKEQVRQIVSQASAAA